MPGRLVAVSDGFQRAVDQRAARFGVAHRSCLWTCGYRATRTASMRRWPSVGSALQTRFRRAASRRSKKSLAPGLKACRHWTCAFSRHDNAGKPEGIHLEIGRRPHAALGNSTGDKQMLEYTKGGDGARLSMLV